MTKTIKTFKKIGVKEKKLPHDLNVPEKKSTVNPIEDQVELLKKQMHNTSDLTLEDMYVGSIKSKLCFIDSICDSTFIYEKIQQPLSLNGAINEEKLQLNSQQELTQLFSSAKLYFSKDLKDMGKKLIEGYALLLISELDILCFIEVKGSEKRTISEPTTQTIIRGPKDGFVEDIQTNISLIRSRIKNQNLCFRKYTIGDDTGTSVIVAYLGNIVNDKILKEITQRIEDIKTFAIFESANIEEMIADKTFTPFPLVYNSERPDSVTAHILSGKVAILVDGTPFAITAPATFNDFFSISEDYYQPFFMATFLRIIRYFSFVISLLLPSLYVAIITFHHEMIPTALITKIFSQREGIPFPAVIEALVMELTFEILREAGIRMPRAVGQTVSIVGGLVIGQSAVEAGIVSNFMVIIVALTAIASFVSPVYNLAISTRLLRFIFIILGGTIGFYGIILGLIFMVAHMNSLRSFGVSYLTPVTPFYPEDQQDTFVRVPFFFMLSRPKFLKTKKPAQQYKDNSPTPPPIKEEGQKE
ncbi:spore germination protein [Cytobacillus gottheilii]|uniref:Spore germination protein n=1 Tax=Cytobacillus gottheilii TaxID=859144 RepID=A0ABX8FD05_9BACI|nr:spore germination protein [Cytobacillus gottheilii]QVY62234.1 spore germination protein [Cytobacillus gottheilii]